MLRNSWLTDAWCDHLHAEVTKGSDAGSEATGCVFTTDKFEVTVYRVVGSEQAALHPDTEAWAAPYTW